MKIMKKIATAGLASVLALSMAGCKDENSNNPSETAVPDIEYEAASDTTDDNYVNSVTYTGSTTRGVDDLGRTLTIPSETTETKSGKYVGMFYFLWQGQHGSDGPYDNSIIAQVEGATDSSSAWMEAGGGQKGEMHFWGQPLFGYYKSNDTWVMRKHAQMLGEAGVDFICIDCTNAYTYTSNALKLMKVFKEMQDEGYNVPQICFYTNTAAAQTMETIYEDIYKAHPEYESLWFKWDGKPLIIGTLKGVSEEMQSFFRIKLSQWPNSERLDDGFPWMEFDRYLTDDAVYGMDGRKEVVNVSVAQHCGTVAFSSSAWYGKFNRTRSFHDGENDTSENAEAYGYNMAQQFEWAIEQDPEIIFITGWNEWTAQRQTSNKDEKIVFVDCADPNNSRDIEPMSGGFGDNYYMQMISYIRQFKGTEGNQSASYKSININGGFAQWNDIKAYYKDYTGDTEDRNAQGYGTLKYTDKSGRNDISEMKVSEDAENVYFFVKTQENITAAEGNNWMNLFISTDLSAGWNGFEYVLNYKAPDKDGKLYLGKLADSTTYTVTALCEVDYRLLDNMMMVSIPKSALGITAGASLTFKWSDNCTEGDIYGFYTTGDAAPIGRLGYYYGY